MPPTAHILVVDDHFDIRTLLEKYLSKNGFRVTTAASAADARKQIAVHAFDLVILDVMMPGEDGLSLCRHLRATGSLPIILLTAMAEEIDRIVGLEMGADDYLTKPFNPRELLARVRAVLRRVESLPPSSAPEIGTWFTFSDWRLDVGRRELVGSGGVSHPLSTGEFDLLTVFLRHPGVVLSRDQLLDHTRSRSAALFDRSIDNQVSRLRKKVEKDPKNPLIIQTVWGGGYKLAVEVKTS